MRIGCPKPYMTMSLLHTRMQVGQKKTAWLKLRRHLPLMPSLSELTALRDTLYDMDAITFRGLAKLNQLIAKYGGQGISNTILDERRWLETV